MNPPRHRVRLWVALLLWFMLAACAKTAQDYIESAQAFQAKGRDREAAIELKNALASDPENAYGNFLLGRLLLKVGNPVDAQLALARALKLGRSPADVLPVLAEALLETENYAEAIEALKGDLDLDRNVMGKLAALRGRAYLGQGSLLEARTQFHLAMNDLPAEGKLGFVRLAIAGNDRKAAQSQLDELIASDPGNVDAWIARGEVLRGDGRTDDALAAFREASKIEPNHVVALLSEALVLITRNELEAGRKLLDRAAEISPLKPMLEFARGLLAFKERRYEDARAALQRLLQAVPSHAPALLLAGSLNYSTEQYELAQNSYVAFLMHHPGNLYARKMLAATLMAKGQPRIAANVVEPVLEKSQDPELLALAGRAYLTMGRTARASDLLTKAVDLAPKNADLRTSLGVTYLASGRRAQAIAEFEAAIALAPENARPDHSLTMMLLADKQFDRAEKIALGITRRLPQAPEGPMLRGAVELARKDDARARAHFERALAMNPTYVPAAEALADIERRAGNPDAQRSRMEDILARDPKQMEALLRLARLNVEQGRSEQGTAGLRAILTEHPRALQALLLLARLQLRTGKFQDAIATARRASEEHPWDAGAVDTLAEAQLAAGDTQAALLTLARLAEMRPGQPEPHLKIAATQAAEGDFRSAVSRLNAVLRRNPRNVRAQAMMADVFISMKRADEAMALARALQSNAPDSPEGYRIEGDLLLATGGSSIAASALFERANKLEPSGKLLVRLHRAQTLASSRPASTEPLRRWLTQNPDDDSVRLYLGDAYGVEGRHREAVVEYANLLKRFPNHHHALNNMAWAMHQLGDEAALGYAERAAKLKPEEPRVLDTLGNILLARGRTAEATQVLLTARAKASDDPEVRLSLAKALIEVGDTGRARKELEAVVSLHGSSKEHRAAQALLTGLPR